MLNATLKYARTAALALALAPLMAAAATAAELWVESATTVFWPHTGLLETGGGGQLFANHIYQYKGPCQGQLTYQGYFRVHNSSPTKGTIKFRHVRSDGYKGPVKTIFVPPAGTQGTPSGPSVNGWHVVGPTVFDFDTYDSITSEPLPIKQTNIGWVKVEILSPSSRKSVKHYMANYSLCVVKHRKIKPRKRYPKRKIAPPPVQRKIGPQMIAPKLKLQKKPGQ